MKTINALKVRDNLAQGTCPVIALATTERPGFTVTPM
jgi:hypothetical protein